MMTLQYNRHFHARNDAPLLKHTVQFYCQQIRTCAGALAKKLSTWSHLLQRYVRKAVTDFSVVTMIITISGKINATWRTFLFIVNTFKGFFLYTMYGEACPSQFRRQKNGRTTGRRASARV